jgi:molybdopterin-containing oxidoreductase family molybdopterin binding subunit
MIGQQTVPSIIGPDEKITEAELTDRVLKYHFGEDKGLEWFMENGFITWEKKPEEAYWRWFVDARAPFYHERFERERDQVKTNAERIGFHLEWNQYTPLVSYFPSVVFTEFSPDSEYDLFLISYRDPLLTHRFTVHNPYIDEMAQHNPFTYSIAMHEETARQKGIKDRDTVTLENAWGIKITGKVKLTQLIHPKVVAAVGLGSFARGMPISRGKGVNPNALIKGDQDHMCPITGSAEPTVRVKAYT